MHGGNRCKGDQYSVPQRAFLRRCTVCAMDDSADHWIRRCPHTAMVQYRVDCTNSIATYIQSIKTHAVAQVLWKVFAMATHAPDGYRIWTANWPAERQRELQPLIEKACRKVSAATLRKSMVQLHSYFILALRQMWALKSLLPMHEQIAARLSTDMSSFARLYHIKDHRRQKFSPPIRPPRNPSYVPPPVMRHQHPPRTVEQWRTQQRNSQAKERRAYAQHQAMHATPTPFITNFFGPVVALAPGPPSGVVKLTDIPFFLPI